VEPLTSGPRWTVRALGYPAKQAVVGQGRRQMADAEARGNRRFRVFLLLQSAERIAIVEAEASEDAQLTASWQGAGNGVDLRHPDPFVCPRLWRASSHRSRQKRPPRKGQGRIMAWEYKVVVPQESMPH
jgi:hypothetical protein